MKKLLMIFLLAISSAAFGQGSQLSQLDGEWYSNQWKYGYKLTSGVGVATSTNSPNFKVGDRIIFLQQSSDKKFEGTQVYTDGKFYKITVQQQSNDTLLFKGEKNVSWTMTRKTQTTAQAATSTTSTTASRITPLASASPLPAEQWTGTVDELSDAVTRLARHIKMAEDWLQTHPNDEVIKADLKNNLETYQSLNKQLEIMDRAQKTQQQQQSRQNLNNQPSATTRNLEPDHKLGSCLGVVMYKIEHGMKDKINDLEWVAINEHGSRFKKMISVMNECFRQNPNDQSLDSPCVKRMLSPQDSAVISGSIKIKSLIAVYRPGSFNGLRTEDFISVVSLDACTPQPTLKNEPNNSRGGSLVIQGLD
jgi:hypothetical protein